jgi:hypothetical protein
VDISQKNLKKSEKSLKKAFAFLAIGVKITPVVLDGKYRKLWMVRLVGRGSFLFLKSLFSRVL